MAAQQVTYVANGVQIEARLQVSLHSVTHLGYLTDIPLIDAAPFEIERKVWGD